VMLAALLTVRAAQQDADKGCHDAPPDRWQAWLWRRSGLGTSSPEQPIVPQPGWP
jgi:hypothetical protein